MPDQDVTGARYAILSLDLSGSDSSLKRTSDVLI
jgi:hypothetical protein